MFLSPCLYVIKIIISTVFSSYCSRILCLQNDVLWLIGTFHLWAVFIGCPVSFSSSYLSFSYKSPSDSGYSALYRMNPNFEYLFFLFLYKLNQNCRGFAILSNEGVSVMPVRLSFFIDSSIIVFRIITTMKWPQKVIARKLFSMYSVVKTENCKRFLKLLHQKV